MGDKVHQKMEKMTSDFNEMDESELFNSIDEIRDIQKHRWKFEWRLNRPSPLKADFYSYLDYESSLHRLIQLRQGYNNNNNNRKNKLNWKLESAVANRILDIYGRATTRFKGDLHLWFRYMDFCRHTNHTKHLKKVQAKVIRLHPNEPAVFIYAAAWQFDYNLHAEAARNIMQIGLRNCPKSEVLWVEYLRMELTYFHKLKARKVAQGTLVYKDQKADEKQWRDENNRLFMSLDEKSVAPEAQDGETKTGMDLFHLKSLRALQTCSARRARKVDEKQWRDENEELFISINEKNEKNDMAPVAQCGVTETGMDLFREKCLSTLRTVYRGAVETFPSSFNLRTTFFKVLEETDIDHFEEMRREILADMRRDFSKEPEYWDWLARTQITDSKGKEIVPSLFKKAIQVYEDAIKVLPSAKMLSLYARFLSERIFPTDEEKQSSKMVDSSDHVFNAISFALAVHEKREKNVCCITGDLACLYVTLYLQTGKIKEAKTLAEKVCTEKSLDSVDMWVLRISIEMRCITEGFSSEAKADLHSVFELLKKVLSGMTVYKAESLWLMALKTFAKHKNYLEKLVELALACLSRDGGSDDGFSLASAIIELLLQTGGIRCARKTYKRVLALPHPGLVIYKKCIELEKNLALGGDKDSLVEARKLHESALATYNQDVSLWQSYYSLEIKMGTSAATDSLYWRAKKQLKNDIMLLSLTIY